VQCPKCRLFNPDTAIRCDCGYDFRTKTIEASYLVAKRQPQSPGGSTFGGFLGGLLIGLIGVLIIHLVTEARATRTGAWWGFALRAIVAVLIVISR